MKKLAERGGIFLLTTFATAAITNWVAGKPINGLVELKGLSQTFLHSSVPAWAFGLTCLAALLGIYFLATHWPWKLGRVHFVPDSHNNWWNVIPNGMSVSVAGTFSYDGKKELHVIQMYLKGTRPLNNLNVQLCNMMIERPLSLKDFHLGDDPCTIYTNLQLAPVIGKRGEPLRAKLILRDKFNREYSAGTLDFPFMGQR